MEFEATGGLGYNVHEDHEARMIHRKYMNEKYDRDRSSLLWRYKDDAKQAEGRAYNAESERDQLQLINDKQEIELQQ